MRHFLSRRDLPLKDELLLSSWQKWLKYRRFPWKLLIDTLMLCLAVTTTILVSLQASEYDNGVHATFNNLFGDIDGDSAIANEAQFIRQLDRLMSNFYNVSSVSLARFFHIRDAKTLRIQPPLLLLQEYVNGFGALDWNASKFDLPPNFALSNKEYELTEV